MATAIMPLTFSKIRKLITVLEHSVTFCARASTVTPVKPHKPKGQTLKVKHFADFKRLRVIAGKGGDGAMSFSSIYMKEFAGPDGGDGGNGGHVIFTATGNYTSLNHLTSEYKGRDGVRGSSQNCHGANAEHENIPVPLGTVISTEEKQLLTSLEKEGEYYIAARGGAGGKGNHFFLSNENRAPAIAEKGAQGEDRVLLIELRTIAEAGLIGFPNAGKSTLLRAISRARPKVAAYPFTTLNPHVGMVNYDDHVQIAVADIPGLIKGAHLNRGLGISFLKHIERCRCLLYVIDLSVDEPWRQLEDLKSELEQYKPGLSKRPHAIVGNKIDLKVAEKNLELLCKNVDIPIIPVSAKRGLGTTELQRHLRELYEQHSQC